MAVEPTVDSPDAGTTLLAHVAGFDANSRKRGADYQRSGCVQKLTRFDDHTVLGEVRGSRLYTLRLLREGTQWRNDCSCPLGGNCKHVVAAALDWIAHGRAPSRVAAAIAPAAPPRNPFRQHWEPLLAEKVGRVLTPRESALLGQLSSVFHNLSHAGRLYASDLGRLGFATAEARRGPYTPIYEGWWTTPPRDPIELWQYIAYDLESSGVPIPEFLRPVTNIASVRAEIENRGRREAVARWRDRFKHQLAPAANAAPAPAVLPPETLELRLCIGADTWRLETRRDSEAPWKEAPRGFVDRFLRDDAAFARIVAPPAVIAFLALCQQQFRRTYVISFKPTDASARELLRHLLAHPLARTLVVDAGGRPLTFAAEPIVWRVARSETEARDYELALHLPDGTPLPPSALLLPGQPNYYLHRGVIYRGPPALDGNSTAAAIVPAEAIETPDVLTILRQLGTQFPPEIERRFVTVSLRPRLECALEVDFSGNEILTLQLLAVGDDPALMRRWTPRGWQTPADAPEAPTSRSDTITVCDFAAADRVAAQLDALKLGHDDYQQRWVRRITKTFPEEFLAWREALPPGVDVLASGELASLFGAPVRASIDFDLIEAQHRDWFDLALVLKPEDATLTRAEIALLLKARGKLVRLPGKGWRRLSVHLEDDSASALEAAGFERDTIAEAALAGERHRFHALQLAHSGVAEHLPQRQAETLRSRARDLARPTPPEIPPGLRAELRPYQKEGFHFLAFLSANRLGGVLADDMGLGKTVQTLAWLLWLAEQRPAKKPLRALVVCPKSVVGNWEAETAKFAPSLQTARFNSAIVTSRASATDAPLITLANYTQLRLGADYFHGQRWDAVILDEGQFIKTPTSKVAQVARELPGEHRLILTGTPIENRLLDLWSLFAFALPGLLGTQASFKRHYTQDQAHALTRLRGRVRHFLLRRTKAQVAADLPPRMEEDVFVELDGEQRTLYEAELKRARAALLKVNTARDLDRARFNILASLLRLRQICCHPALIDPAHRALSSAKLDELLERIEELRDEGHQVLVFSQFVEMLELIREKLVAAGIEHLLLTGQTENRDELVATFQGDKSRTVFLLSLKAAGFGLNLTAASYVVLFDPWWNPAVEAQAIDRTHRIGQSVPVNAYRLIARGTVEEKIRALQREKSALAGAVVQEESLASVLDLDSLRQILA